MQKKLINSNVTFEAIPSFDWEAHMIDHPSLRENKKIKKHPGDNSKIYCHADYAQSLYELYSGAQLDLEVPEIGKIVNGKITSVSDRYAMIDVNWREDAIIDLSKENSDYLKYIQKDFPIEVIIDDIKRGFNGTNTTYASYTKNIQSKKREEIMSSIGNNEAYLCKVKELIHGGYFVDIDGISCFMPGSLGGMNKLVNFESILGTQIYVVPINYSKEKDYIVVSHREYLKALVPTEIKKLEFNKLYDGFVTGCSKHGIFVEFNGCLTGLISRLSVSEEFADAFNNRTIKPGTALSFYISEIVDNEKISLSQIPVEPKQSAWDDIEKRYTVPSTVTGKIRKIVKYGVFIEIEPRVVGLLHKSQLDEDFEFSVGNEIEVKIVKIDKESKKLDFSM